MKSGYKAVSDYLGGGNEVGIYVNNEISDIVFFSSITDYEYF